MIFFSKKHKLFLVLLVFLISSFLASSQTTPKFDPSLTPGGANSLVFRFIKQVWLNPTIILAKREFEASTHVKLLLIPRINNNDTSSNSKIENAFDKALSAMVFNDNVQGSIKFYFNSQNAAKPFTFATTDELWCKFTPVQKDTVEQLLNKLVATNTRLSDFSKLPFNDVINQASKYCKKILISNTANCGGNPQPIFSSININSTPAKLNFEQVPFVTQPTGDVDEQQYDALKAYYNSATDSTDNSNYPIAWKAMSTSNDVIKIKLKKKNPNFNLADVKFKNSGGTETYATQISPDDNTILKINIPGKPAGSIAEVVAYYTAPSTPGIAATTYPIGAFNVQFYQSKAALKLVLVNLGNAKMPDVKAVQEVLTKTYGSIFINWQVSVLDYNLPNDLNKNLIIKNSVLLSNYPACMQPIIKDFKSKNNVDANTYYLFLGCTNNNSWLGYMPRARNIGFIFDNNPHTIAHELGHGAFNLKHIFSSDELGEGNRGQTDNLMDYAPVNGSTTKPQDALYKYQWDLIHNPSFVGWFEGDDEEGAMATSMVAIDSMFLYNGTKLIKPNSYLLISTTPEMPNIKIKPFKDNYTGNAEIEVRLKIEYKRWNSANTQVRNDSTFYPSSEWKKIKINESWDIDFGKEMRGGKVYVYYKSGTTTKSKIFYIRGSNPTEQEVKNYLTSQNYSEWFLIKIIRHESGSTVVGQAMKQFNAGTKYDTARTNTIGCPNLGYPRGFGLMQLDNFGTTNGVLLVATPNQLWNWKANIDRGVQFLRIDKINWAERRINSYLSTIQKWDKIHNDDLVNDSIYIKSGDNTGSKVLTIQEGTATNNEIFAITPTSTQKRIQNALTLKYYNGGAYCTLLINEITKKPYWTIDRLNNQNPPFNYVERICGENQ
ncbi:MAG: hypothetical protein ABI315_15885 [Bacteroidia bacterium]